MFCSSSWNRLGAATASIVILSLYGTCMGSRAADIDVLLSPLQPLAPERFAIGVSRGGVAIPGVLSGPDAGVTAPSRRLVLVAGLDGDGDSARAAVELFRRLVADTDHDWTIALLPLADPDRFVANAEPATSEGVEMRFPPPDDAYHNPLASEAQYLWRWLAMFGPDAVVQLAVGDEGRWHGPGATGALVDGELASALGGEPVATIGSIPAWRLDLSGQVAESIPSAADFLERLHQLCSPDLSPARAELARRSRRTARSVALELENHYGQTFEPVEYLQGTALLARWRLARLIGDAEMQADAEQLAARWIGRSTFGDQLGGGVMAGHLVFAELAQHGGQDGYTALVRAVADLGFDDQGNPRPAMPAHNEMSDAVFMSTPILVAAGRLTGEAKYDEMAARHLRLMLELNLRGDGLHRHSPLDEAAWGRGNGFPALGLAFCLDTMAEDHPQRQLMLDAFVDHLDALLAHQDASGMWHQVIDRPESYRELTSTCMITYAMIRGVRQGWLDEQRYLPAIQRAWQALKLRIGSDGVLTDVCTGTGKQRSMRAYYDRPAILGKDNRGGAMAMLVATEYAAWQEAEAQSAVPRRIKATAPRRTTLSSSCPMPPRSPVAWSTGANNLKRSRASTPLATGSPAIFWSATFAADQVARAS